MASVGVPLILMVASPAVAAAIVHYKTRHMARAIRRARVDPADEGAVARCLHRAGFGTPAIAAIGDCARAQVAAGALR